MTSRDAALLDRFLEMMAAEAGAAGNTLTAYRSDLRLAGEAMGGLADADEAALRMLADGWASLASSSVARKATSSIWSSITAISPTARAAIISAARNRRSWH
jgi:integrase/recombinase XerD